MVLPTITVGVGALIVALGLVEPVAHWRQRPRLGRSIPANAPNASGAGLPYIRTDVRLLSYAGAMPDVCDLLCLDLPKAEAARHAQPSMEALEAAAGAARALGDPTRLAVAVALRDAVSACVCDLAWIVVRDERLVSHHARQLKAAGLARSERNGKMVMYALTPHGAALLGAVVPAVEAS